MSTEEKTENRFEVLVGVVLALFAAILAINDLGAGKYGDDELISHNEKANAYQWYNSKGIKQTLEEGQRDLLQALISAKSIREEQESAVKEHVKSLSAEIDRYKKEKKEILLGSEAVGKDNWIQDIDGKLGQIVGAKDWEKKANLLGNAGDEFDLATLFLQISLVIGAISLVVQNKQMKKTFFYGMILLGLLGMSFSIYAYTLAMKA